MPVSGLIRTESIEIRRLVSKLIFISFLYLTYLDFSLKLELSVSCYLASDVILYLQDMRVNKLL